MWIPFIIVELSLFGIRKRQKYSLTTFYGADQLVIFNEEGQSRAAVVTPVRTLE